MYKFKRFSKSKRDEAENKRSTPKDANAMTALGKTGLQAAGVLGTAAGVELGRGAYHASKVAKDVSKVKKLKDNKVVREQVKNLIKDKAPTKSIANDVIDKVRWAEKNAPEFSKIDKIQKSLNWWNKGSNLSRTVLNNADKYAKMGIDSYIDKHGAKMTEEEINALRRIPKTVRHAGKAATGLKNAKAIGKGALLVGQAGGLLYLNGRGLQEGGSRGVTNIKKDTV